MAATHAAAFSDARPWSAAEFAGLLAQSGVFAAGDNRCFALVRVAADEAELLTIATDPAHRRRGLARAAMTDWMAQAAHRGAARAFLEVAADNRAALALYRGLGFGLSGRRKAYYRRPGQAGADALVLTRSLPPGQPADSGPNGQKTG